MDEKNKNCDILICMEVLNFVRMTKNHYFSAFQQDSAGFPRIQEHRIYTFYRAVIAA